MTVEILEIHAASAVVMIDLARLLARRIGPVGKLAFANPAENLVELGFADQKGVVLRRDFVGVHVVEMGPVLVITSSNRPQCFGAGRFNISVRNFTEALLSRADRDVS